MIENGHIYMKKNHKSDFFYVNPLPKKNLQSIIDHLDLWLKMATFTWKKNHKSDFFLNVNPLPKKTSNQSSKNFQKYFFM